MYSEGGGGIVVSVDTPIHPERPRMTKNTMYYHGATMNGPISLR